MPAGCYTYSKSDTTWKTAIPGLAPIFVGPKTTFAHPGMYATDQLSYVAGQLAASAEPWTTEYNRMINTTSTSGASTGTKLSSLSWSPTPWDWVGRGSYNGDDTVRDSDLNQDVRAALCHALIWAYKGTRANALKAIEILNAWADTITTIRYDTTTWQDGHLLAGWTGTVFARAADIIATTFTADPGETGLNLSTVRAMFTNVWWPRLSELHAGPGFNTYTTIADAMCQIAVLLDDWDKFSFAVDYIRGMMPALIFMAADTNPYAWGNGNITINYSSGGTLTAPNGLPFAGPGTIFDKSTLNAHNFMLSYWFKPLSLPNGLWGETGRDFHHTGMGFAGVGNLFETAYHQGIDLYTEFQSRMVAALELFTGYVYSRFVNGQTTPAGWPFGSAPTTSFATSTQRATFEIWHHHYVTRKGLSMPNLSQYMTDYARPGTLKVDVAGICWETLTHYGTP